jgi:hypothetical protein
MRKYLFMDRIAACCGVSWLAFFLVYLTKNKHCHVTRESEIPEAT